MEQEIDLGQFCDVVAEILDKACWERREKTTAMCPDKNECWSSSGDSLESNPNQVLPELELQVFGLGTTMKAIINTEGYTIREPVVEDLMRARAKEKRDHRKEEKLTRKKKGREKGNRIQFH
jgi:hypothetical protein